MAQLSIYDKLKHFSDKDLTCSIGQKDSVDIVFRHDSWHQFTSSEHIAVYIGKTGKLKFDEPDKKKGVIYKLKKSNVGTPDIAEHTRYLRINGQAHPELLDAAQKMIGDYNIPRIKCEDVKEPDDRAPKSVTLEEVRKAMGKPSKIVLESRDTKRDDFRADALVFLNMAQSPEERVEIWKTLASVYGKREVYEDKPGKWNI